MLVGQNLYITKKERLAIMKLVYYVPYPENAPHIISDFLSQPSIFIISHFFFSILSTVCMVHCRKNLRVINYVKETFPLIKDETFLNKNASYPIGSESKNLKRTSKFESLQIKLWKLLTSTLGALVKKLKGERFFLIKEVKETQWTKFHAKHHDAPIHARKKEQGTQNE